MKRLKGMLCILLVLAMSVPAFAVSDLPGDWSKTAVDKAVSAGIINIAGDKVRAGDNLKRWELGYMLSAAFGAVQAANLSSFTDIKAGDEGFAPMGKAVKMGLFQGEGSLLRPNDAITRQEAFVVLARALGLKSVTYASLDKFSDKAKIADWAKPQLAALAGAGYVAGSGGVLNPSANISRKEFCQVLYNLFTDYVRQGSLTSAKGGVVVSAGGTTLSNMTVNGNLVIGDGVTDTVTLDNVTVTGRLIVRGGDVKVDGASKLDTVSINNLYGKTSFTAQPLAKINTMEALTNVSLSGIFTTLNLSAAEASLAGFAKTTDITSPVKLSVTEGAMTTVTFERSANGSTFVLSKDVTVGEVSAIGSIAASGDGSICLLKAYANGTTLKNNNSKIQADSSATGVFANMTPVGPGYTSYIDAQGKTKPYPTSSISENRLSGIKVGNVNIQNFDKDIYWYAVEVGPHDASTLECVTLNNRASVTAVQVAPGTNKATLKVKAPDNLSTMTYTVWIYQKK